MCVGANITSANLHKRSFADWLDVYDDLEEELNSKGLKTPTTSASLMHIYTVWRHLLPAARAEIAAWGNRD
jgi:hypothetical protein